MPLSRPVLSFDTSLQGVSCGINDPQSGQGFKIVSNMPRGQAEILVPTIRKLLSYAEISFDGLEAVVTTIGPGAFTGLRIGLSTARALRLSLNCPVYGINTLDVLARQFLSTSRGHFINAESRICVLIETKRQDFYTRFYTQNGDAESPPQSLGSGELANLIKPSDLLVGDGVARLIAETNRYQDQFIDGFYLADPKIMAQIYKESARDKIDPETESLRPVYLRDADVSRSKTSYRSLSDH